VPTTVIGVLRRFLPAFLRQRPALHPAQWRAIWALTHCRTPVMGGHLLACEPCSQRHFAYHSCNHRSCPQCGQAATAQWVARQLAKRVGAPYFMVTFTLPAELRHLFAGAMAKTAYDLFFTASAAALREKLAAPKWLGAAPSGFTAVLHTWNQRMGFHPHIHFIVPGVGIDPDGRVVTVKNANFLLPVQVLSKAFRTHFRQALKKTTCEQHAPPAADPAVWNKDWGVHIQPCGSGGAAIKYLGAYVCRTAIADSRILSADKDTVTFRWKDRANGGALRSDTIPGTAFVKRYLRHVLPRGLHAVRHYGFCHPAAKAKLDRVAFHTGRPLLAGPFAPVLPPKTLRPCPCCGKSMRVLATFHPAWAPSRAPPSPRQRCTP